MQKQNYPNSITVDMPPGEAFDKIGRVPEWWGTIYLSSRVTMSEDTRPWADSPRTRRGMLP